MRLGVSVGLSGVWNQASAVMHICSTDAPADVAPTMLAVLRLPASWHQVLKTVRPVFRRSSTFALFVVLATGLVARTTRRTVVGMLAGAGMGAVVSFHSACRFFSQYAWDTDQLGLAVARLIVERLLDKDTSITVAIDDTLFRRWGPKVHHAFWTHDGSAQGPAKLGRGNRWVIVGIIVTLPFFKPSGVPSGAVSTLGRQGHRVPGAAGRGHAVCAGPSVPRQDHPRWWVTPPTTAARCWWQPPRSPPGLPANAALFAPAPPRTGRRGRPRTKGRRLGALGELAATATLAHRVGKALRPHRHGAGRGDRCLVVRRVRGYPRSGGTGPRTRHHHRL